MNYFIVTDDGQILNICQCHLVELSDDQVTALVKIPRQERVYNLPEESCWYELS